MTNETRCRKPEMTNVAISAIAAAALFAVATLLSSSAPAQADDRCYQKLFYQICSGDDGQWRVNPVPALPMPPMPPPASPPAPG